MIMGCVGMRGCSGDGGDDDAADAKSVLEKFLKDVREKIKIG